MKLSKTKILIVDDEQAICKMLSDTLVDEGFDVYVAHNGVTALQQIQLCQPDVVFLDIWMPGEKDGLEVLKESVSTKGHRQFVMISGHGTIETAVQATKIGAWDFLEKPISIDRVLILISNILAYQEERKDKDSLLTYIRQGLALIGESDQMKQAKQIIGRLASSPDWIYINGEAGSGKSLIAKNIHYLSGRATQSFIEFRCSNYPMTLIEYEFFGYEKGEFIGADKSKKGILELSHRGTLFLRDVDCLDIEIQKKLLHFFKTGEMNKSSRSNQGHFDLRIISSSSINLDEKVKDGDFLPELYSILRGALLQTYPLVHRKKDIPILVDYFSEFYAREGGTRVKFFSDKVLLLFENHSWPGNVRELKNLIERIYILSQGDYVDLATLKVVGIPLDSSSSISRIDTFRDARAQFEKEFLLKKIAENNGNISKTAENIGLERSYLHRKIKSYGIE